MIDPIINSIRKIRDTHSKKFNYDVFAIALDYKKRQGEFKQKLDDINKINKSAQK